MSDCQKTTSEDSLEAVAVKIVEHATRSDQHIIKAAMLIRDVRRRVDAGEAGDVTWYAWARLNIKLSPSRLRELQRIANAKNPKKELERQRKNNRRNQHKNRNNQKSLEAERKRVIAWAKSAPLVHVEQIDSQIQRINHREELQSLSLEVA